MELSSIECDFSEKNFQCLGNECPFHKK
jgi:hypothetical protein